MSHILKVPVKHLGFGRWSPCDSLNSLGRQRTFTGFKPTSYLWQYIAWFLKFQIAPTPPFKILDPFKKPVSVRGWSCMYFGTEILVLCCKHHGGGKRGEKVFSFPLAILSPASCHLLFPDYFAWLTIGGNRRRAFCCLWESDLYSTRTARAFSFWLSLCSLQYVLWVACHFQGVHLSMLQQPRQWCPHRQ